MRRAGETRSLWPPTCRSTEAAALTHARVPIQVGEYVCNCMYGAGAASISTMGKRGLREPRWFRHRSRRVCCLARLSRLKRRLALLDTSH